MARLILLNGPPGIGKSTLAQRYVDEHPLALNLDIDSVLRRRSLPQFLGRPQFLEQAEQVAAETGADYLEFGLMDNRDEVLRRFAERTAAAADPAHVEAGRLMEQLGGEPMVAAMYDRLLLVLSTRPRAQSVHCRDGAPDGVHQELLSRIG